VNDESPQDRGRSLTHECLDAGFALAGVCAAAPSAHSAFFRGWLGAGKLGEMAWLANNIETRLDPRVLLPGARAIVMVADLYTPRGAGGGAEPSKPGFGKVARYARGDDYHDVIKRRLHALCDAWRLRWPNEQFRACVDTAPLMEREHAARAGLGWIGKHTLLIHPRKGSYLLLGAVVTTLDAAPPQEQDAITDHCGACTRCIDVCPTDAIAPYTVDASRCISYLTIEKRGELPESLSDKLSGWLYGCDICQEVCPHNSPRPTPSDDTARPEYVPRFVALNLDKVSRWTPDDRARTLRRSSMKRATLEMMKRNAESLDRTHGAG